MSLNTYLWIPFPGVCISLCLLVLNGLNKLPSVNWLHFCQRQSKAERCSVDLFRNAPYHISIKRFGLPLGIHTTVTHYNKAA